MEMTMEKKNRRNQVAECILQNVVNGVMKSVGVDEIRIFL
jgi:hypothetical protein